MLGGQYATVEVHRLTEGPQLVQISAADIDLGFIYLACPECKATGLFKVTEVDSQPCNFCKGGLRIPVAIT